MNDKKETLKKLFSGEHEIDKEFVAEVTGRIYNRKDLKLLKSLASKGRPKFECNYLHPLILKYIGIEGLSEIQILKGIIIELAKNSK